MEKNEVFEELYKITNIDKYFYKGDFIYEIKKNNTGINRNDNRFIYYGNSSIAVFITQSIVIWRHCWNCDNNLLFITFTNGNNDNRNQCAIIHFGNF